MSSSQPASLTIRSVVFDLDGILIDTEPIFHESSRRLLAGRNLPFDPTVLQRMMGTPGRDALQIFRDHYQMPETIEELAAICSRYFYEVLGDRPAPLLPGAVELLKLLVERGIPRAIATSSSRRYVHRVFEPHGLMKHFSFILTCDDVQRGKPAPEVYEKAAAGFGHPPGEMLVLEDSPAGLRAAKSAGAFCVMVPHALVPRDQLQGADAIVSSLIAPDLLRLIGL